MNYPWAILLAREDANALAALRLSERIEVAEVERFVWIRSRSANEPVAQALRGLPAVGRYEWLPDNRLRRIENRIPSEVLPELRWQALGSWLRVEFPSAALPAAEPRRVPIQLVRSTEEQPPDLLLTGLTEWAGFALRAGEARLRALRFAVDSEARVLVSGKPLPPLPGRRFVVRGSIAIPAGFKWHPEVGVEVLMRRFGVAADTLVLWQENGTFSRLRAEQFVPATRSGVRTTAQGFAPGP